MKLLDDSLSSLELSKFTIDSPLVEEAHITFIKSQIVPRVAKANRTQSHAEIKAEYEKMLAAQKEHEEFLNNARVKLGLDKPNGNQKPTTTESNSEEIEILADDEFDSTQKKSVQHVKKNPNNKNEDKITENDNDGEYKGEKIIKSVPNTQKTNSESTTQTSLNNIKAKVLPIAEKLYDELNQLRSTTYKKITKWVNGAVDAIRAQSYNIGSGGEL
jgi:hypothetical protein